MIGVIDPAIFLPRDEKDVQADLDFIARACLKGAIALPPIDEYWKDVWSTLARPLEATLRPEAKRALQGVRRLGEQSRIHLPELPNDAGAFWWRGFHQLFGEKDLGSSWEDRMARAVLRAILGGYDVVILTRKLPGRNVRTHASGDSAFDEVVRWVLHVQPKGIGHRQIQCVHHLRNLQEKWTTRFDWRLPAVSDGGQFPFIPPEKWWKPSTKATRTISSKPAWVDKDDNGWARPNIPGGAGYHWDVYIASTSLQEATGLDQLNIVEYGAPTAEGKPGNIHHIPESKVGRFKGVRWK